MSNAVRLIISLALPLAVGFTASQFTTPEIDGWYRTIEKPSWQPPSAVFGPVWTALYILMGIALFLVWKKEAPHAQKRTAITLFGVQLVFNFLWSFLFFRMHRIDLALVEIIILLLLIVLTTIAFSRISKQASWLMVPYIAWVSFATALTYTIWRLNA